MPQSSNVLPYNENGLDRQGCNATVCFDLTALYKNRGSNGFNFVLCKIVFNSQLPTQSSIKDNIPIFKTSDNLMIQK